MLNIFCPDIIANKIYGKNIFHTSHRKYFFERKTTLSDIFGKSTVRNCCIGVGQKKINQSIDFMKDLKSEKHGEKSSRKLMKSIFEYMMTEMPIKSNTVFLFADSINHRLNYYLYEYARYYFPTIKCFWSHKPRTLKEYGDMIKGIENRVQYLKTKPDIKQVKILLAQVYRRYQKIYDEIKRIYPKYTTPQILNISCEEVKWDKEFFLYNRKTLIDIKDFGQNVRRYFGSGLHILLQEDKEYFLSNKPSTIIIDNSTSLNGGTSSVLFEYLSKLGITDIQIFIGILEG